MTPGYLFVEIILIILVAVIILWIFDSLWYSITFGRDLRDMRKEIRNLNKNMTALNHQMRNMTSAFLNIASSRSDNPPRAAGGSDNAGAGCFSSDTSMQTPYEDDGLETSSSFIDDASDIDAYTFFPPGEKKDNRKKNAFKEWILNSL